MTMQDKCDYCGKVEKGHCLFQYHLIRYSNASENWDFCHLDCLEEWAIERAEEERNPKDKT